MKGNIMDNYFRLYSHIYYINNEDYACIYNTITGDMITLKPENARMLIMSEANTNLLEMEGVDMSFYDQLNKMGMGTFYNSPIFVDKATLGLSKPMQRIIKQNYTIRNAQIELTTNCNLDCKFCNKDDNTLFRKTGCKRWKKPLLPLTLEEWQAIVLQLTKLGCKELTFIGGEPLLEFGLLSSIVKFAQRNGITEFTIYTNGTQLDSQILDFIKENKIKLVIQLLSIEPERYDDISGKKDTYKSVYSGLQQLKALSINFTLLYLVNRFNDSEIDKICDFTSKYTNRLMVEYIYSIPANEFYSVKYVDSLYQSNSRLVKPTLPNFQYLKDYNCCYGDKLAISEGGNVFPCIMSRQLLLGNIREEKQLYKLLDTRYDSYKRMSKDKIDGCKRCAYRYGCVECRALEMSASGKPDGMEFCYINKEIRRKYYSEQNQFGLSG